MPFKIGQIVSHNEIIDEFKCGNMGGMRRLLATNSLILISDHTKNLYEDKWFGDVLSMTVLAWNMGAYVKVAEMNQEQLIDYLNDNIDGYKSRYDEYVESISKLN